MAQISETDEPWEPPPKLTVENPLEYSPQTKLKLDCPQQMELQNPYMYAPIEPWIPQPSFWYDSESAFKGQSWMPNGELNDYGFSILSKPEELFSITKRLQVERKERYIPGEIYKNKIPKAPIQEPKGLKGPIIWKEKIPKVFNSKFNETTLGKRPLLIDYIKENEKEFKTILILITNEEQTESKSNLKVQPQEQQIKNIIPKLSNTENLGYIPFNDTRSIQMRKDIKGRDTRFAHLESRINTKKSNTCEPKNSLIKKVQFSKKN